MAVPAFPVSIAVIPWGVDVPAVPAPAVARNRSVLFLGRFHPTKGIDALLRSWRDVERQGTPFKLVPMMAGQLHEVRRDFGIRCFATHHGGASLGYSLVSIREKLKPELMGTLDSRHPLSFASHRLPFKLDTAAGAGQ